jgi:T5SS/PEP-CTERM-associated repeat protein
MFCRCFFNNTPPAYDNSIFGFVRILSCGVALVALCACSCHSQTVNTSGDTNHSFNGQGPWNLKEFDGLRIGQTQTGRLEIEDGGKANNLFDGTGTSGNAFVGSDSGGFGIVDVDGAGSHWVNERVLNVGYNTNANGRLNIDTGGLVTNTLGSSIGVLAGSDGRVRIENGSRMEDGGATIVGAFGAGALTMINGQLKSNAGRLGNRATGDGVAVVFGPTSLWEISGGLNGLAVGNQGTGELTVRLGGRITSTSTIATDFIGNQSGSTGTVNVTGSGSTWASSSNLEIGFAGTGTLNIESGGVVTSNSGTLGQEFTGGNGTANISGTGSHWDNSGSELNVGFFGKGELNITNGGLVTNANAQIGRQRSNDGTERGDGSVTVNGGGSHWNNSGTLFVGVFGDADMRVEDGGLVSSSTGLVGLNDGSSGEVTVTGVGSHWDNSGDMNVGFFDSGSGTLKVESDGLVTVGGSLIVNAPGTVNLSGGKLDVGTLDLSDPLANFNMTGGRLVADQVQGNLEITGGVLAPGDSPGLTSIDGNLNLLVGGSIEFEIGGTTPISEYDTIDVTGQANLFGTIDVDLIDSFEGSLDDSFQLVNPVFFFSAITGSPMFDFSDAELETGLVWDTSTFLNDGTIRISAVPEPGSTTVIVVGLCTLGLVRRRRAA